ncbi:hypothetical protein Q4589_07760 [Cobetia marina]|jgi:predicted membrane protein|uniref:CBU-0592-like domain-containing protein n=1 Tax=Cobetia marina TaxID=28258 RepID=A0ABU9GEN7_COBMA|nr:MULTISPECIES: hypothetical protein [Cobetia]AOM02614.1 hypothetical protein BFX80_16835 [Cobetia marina]MDA5563943.1 hypothetical protein [Cobetia sp. MMG027]MDH2374324.1 hypothetical protein [Cobetia sp. 3AK]MDI6004488.1 hypothetical protein [Cobetia pacifica]MDN2656281.1 hypothetical protein [Cobetia sp. 14N.309.X.WAT.E.A4]
MQDMLASLAPMADIIGMLGTSLVVGAFFLLQIGRLDARSLTYNLMNLSGAILLLISLCINFNLASFVIEVFWIVASLVGLVRWLMGSRPQTV